VAGFGLYVSWFFVAVLLELAWNGPYAVSMGHQIRAYVSFAQTVIWAFAGYRFSQARGDAAWLLRRFAAAAACICVVPFFFIATGQAKIEFTPELLQLSETVARVPNWGVESFLLFGYCWCLTHTLLGRRLFSWSTLGLLACCELWAHMVKCTIFAIIPVTLGIIGLLLHRTGRMSRGLAYVAAVFGLLVIGALIANMRSNGELLDRFLDYIAIRILHVESLQRIAPSVTETVKAASASRLGYLWPEALERFAASPVVGCGFNQEIPEPGGGTVPVHSAYLDVLVGVGLFGTLPVVLAFLRWFGAVWRAIRLPENLPILVPCLGYAVAYLAVVLGEVLRDFYTPTMFIGLVLGIAMKVALLPPGQDGSRKSHAHGDLPFRSG
jgi:O-antigen ligase